MHRGQCHVCAKPLHGGPGSHEGPGPVVMDGEGLSYHHACWCRKIDLAIQARPEQTADQWTEVKNPRKATG